MDKRALKKYVIAKDKGGRVRNCPKFFLNNVQKYIENHMHDEAWLKRFERSKITAKDVQKFARLIHSRSRRKNVSLASLFVIWNGIVGQGAAKWAGVWPGVLEKFRRESEGKWLVIVNVYRLMVKAYLKRAVIGEIFKSRHTRTSLVAVTQNYHSTLCCESLTPSNRPLITLDLYNIKI